MAAGESWDDLVVQAVDLGWAGIEALSGIPGSVGATPIQNVGAYGQEVSQTVAQVRTWDRRHSRMVTFAAADCGFGYRTSRFKAEPGRYVVLGVRFQLALGDLGAPVGYAELARALGVEVGQRAPMREVREAVLALRRSKGMVLDPADHDTWSAGSFFTNPVVAPAVVPEGAPAWPQPDGAREDQRRLADRAGRLPQGLRRPGTGGTVGQAHAGAHQPRVGHAPATSWRWPARSAGACTTASASSWCPNRCWSAASSRSAGQNSVLVDPDDPSVAMPITSSATTRDHREHQQHGADDAGDVAGLRVAGTAELAVRRLRSRASPGPRPPTRTGRRAAAGRAQAPADQPDQAEDQRRRRLRVVRHLVRCTRTAGRRLLPVGAARGAGW